MGSDDVITRFMKLRLIQHGRDIEEALASKKGGNVTVEILYRLYDRVAESTAGLCFLNIDDPKDRLTYKTLSSEVKRYDEWINWMRDIINEGRAFDQQISASEREDMIDYLIQSPEGQREAIELGLVDPGPRDA